MHSIWDICITYLTAIRRLLTFTNYLTLTNYITIVNTGLKFVCT